MPLVPSSRRSVTEYAPSPVPVQEWKRDIHCRSAIISISCLRVVLLQLVAAATAPVSALLVVTKLRQASPRWTGQLESAKQHEQNPPDPSRPEVRLPRGQRNSMFQEPLVLQTPALHLRGNLGQLHAGCLVVFHSCGQTQAIPAPTASAFASLMLACVSSFPLRTTCRCTQILRAACTKVQSEIRSPKARRLQGFLDRMHPRFPVRCEEASLALQDCHKVTMRGVCSSLHQKPPSAVIRLCAHVLPCRVILGNTCGCKREETVSSERL